MVGAWATVLARWGTKTFAEVLQGAIELADHGFPVYEWLEKPWRIRRADYPDVPHHGRDLSARRPAAAQPATPA